jgi:DNA-binding NtrC family response regulator
MGEIGAVRVGNSLATLGGMHCVGIAMTSSNAHDPPEVGSADLTGLRILVVEDSWHLGIALESLLQAMGAEVAGPVATTAEAERLISEHTPDIAIVDFNLRGGELAHGLIDRLHDQGARVIVTSGYAVLPLAPGKAAAILQKPFSEAQLIATLLLVTEQKNGLVPERTPSDAHTRPTAPPTIS